MGKRKRLTELHGHSDASFAAAFHPDPRAAMPADYTFTAADNGVHTFANGVTLYTPGTQTVTVQDTADSSITGSATIAVSP